MSVDRKSLKRTVFYDEETGELCSCSGDFWKTCPLRVINQLPCQRSIITINPIKNEEIDPADSGSRSLDWKLRDLKNSLRHLEKKFKI